jgi:hypothetical protein
MREMEIVSCNYHLFTIRNAYINKNKANLGEKKKENPE